LALIAVIGSIDHPIAVAAPEESDEQETSAKQRCNGRSMATEEQTEHQK
jgi:hypothetical protein